MDRPSIPLEHPSASIQARRWRLGMRQAPALPRYVLSVLLFGAALGSRFVASGFLPPQGFPFLTFFPAVMLSAWLAGLGPGLVCSVLSIAGAWYYFIPPAEAFVPLSRPDTVALLFFSGVLLIDCVIIHLMNQAVASRARAVDDLEQSRTQALAAAEAAERERSLLDATFNTVPAGIIVADAQGRLVRMSRATEKIWGIAPYSPNVEGYGEWKGWWADGSERHGQRIEPHEWGLARSLHGEHCHDIVEVEPFGRPGERVVTILAAAPVLDAAGRIIGGVVVQVDITDRIQAENALREADRQKDTFLATLSHELRNPLAPIRAAAHVIRLSDLPDERVRKAAAVIERQGAQLTRLVDDLLDISRLKFGNLTLQREEVDLRQVVDSAIETSRPLIQASGHAFMQHLPDEPVRVDVDVTRVAQCVSNLVNNACKFTPSPGGRVSVALEVLDDGQACVRVQDNGHGIAPANLAKVFELFEQEHRTGLLGNTGLGIGLALTRRLVEMHGGTVTARSDGEGLGATFEIRLPMTARPQAKGSPRPGRVEAHAPDGAVITTVNEATVLVVDDNEDAASTLQLLLQMQGLAVETAGDGASAVAAAHRCRPRVIVLDIGLPDMTGYEVARSIRAASVPPAWPHRPVLIALTGWGQAKDRERALEAGFDHHLTKPADPDRIAALVQEQLQPA